MFWASMRLVENVNVNITLGLLKRSCFVTFVARSLFSISVNQRIDEICLVLDRKILFRCVQIFVEVLVGRTKNLVGLSTSSRTFP